jgi:hypothetical protein
MSETERRLIRLLTRNGFAAQTRVVAELRELPSERALTILGQFLKSELRRYAWKERLVRRGVLVLLAVAVAFVATLNFGEALVALVASALWGAGGLCWLRPTPGWRNARAAARDLVERCDEVLCCPALLELAAPLEKLPAHWPGRSLRAAVEERLTVLLPRLDQDAARRLTPGQRTQLRQMLGRLRHRPDTLVSILLALGTARDSASLVDARLLVLRHPSDRVRAAARECLLELGASQK